MIIKLKFRDWEKDGEEEEGDDHDVEMKKMGLGW